jgi:superfamily I DNA/RNA helicase
MARIPSPLQRAILEYIANERGNLLIIARAGTGKSSTLEMICNVPSVKASNVILLAFNKSIETELKARGLPAATFHSFAFRAVGRALSSRNGGRRIQVDGNKCGRLWSMTVRGVPC